MSGTRYAIVSGLFGTGRDPKEVVSAYLPARYKVLGTTTVQEFGRSVTQVIIAGTDYHGWTLDSYVIPRLGSGCMACREVPAQNPLVQEIIK